MGRCLIAGVLLGSLATAATQAKAQTSDPLNWLEELEKATSLRRAGIKPWELKLSFNLNSMAGKPQDEGTVDLKWRGSAKEVITVESKLLHGELGNTSSDDPKIGREEYLLRELITETVSPVGMFPKAAIDVKQHDQKFGDVTLTCLTIVRTGTFGAGEGLPPTYCVEPQQPNSLRAHQEGLRGAIRNRPGKFQNTSVALDNRVLYAGVAAITGKVESLVLLTDEPASAAPEPIAEPAASPKLAGAVIAGQKIGGEQPQYPQIARDAHVGGTVILTGVIDTSGHIGHLIPIASPDGSLTRAALDAVRTWTYKPYLLNGRPVEVSTTVSVNFNLR